MNRSTLVLSLAIVCSALLIATGRGEPTAVEVSAPGTWSVINCPPGGQSNGFGTSILLNTATGETWWASGGSSSWNRMSR